MSTPTMDELHATWTRRRAQTNHGASVTAVNLLAEGRPVTPEALATATGWSAEQVATYLENARRTGVEVEDGAIVGLALTLRPTGHRFRVRGNDLYTWCGFDALFLPIMLGEPAEVASTCPVTGVGDPVEGGAGRDRVGCHAGVRGGGHRRRGGHLVL